MKRTVSILLSLAMLLPALTACAQTENGTQSGIAGETVIQQSIQIAPDGVPAYTVIRPDGEKNDSPTVQAALNVRRVLEEKIGSAVKISTDWAGQNADMTQIAEVPEILIGMTNRPESEKMTADLKPGEYVIAVKGNKIVICGYDDRTTAQATEKFLGDYAAEDNLPAVELPGNLYVKGTADYSVSAVHNTAYTDMGDVILEAFTDTFYQRGILKGAHFWDAAEILESYIDAYEQTGKDTYLTNIKEIARAQGAREKTTWQSNEYNDDIAWMCIAYARIYLLTGEEVYLTISKNNFDAMYKRAYSDDLGGGLFWRTDNQTKNSCINCPASIAACLLGKALGDDSYYEKAKGLMDWEFAHMYDSSSGAVYDSYNLKGEKNKWASTYNQGTFIGACTLLAEKYGDELYLPYAAKAADYAMNRLEMKDGVLNGENSGGDLIGFKGILTRWLYRYAEYAGDTGILYWLQNNADTAYANRNQNNFIWTTWADKTPDNTSDMDLFGFSTAIALLFNCEPWWELPNTGKAE